MCILSFAWNSTILKNVTVYPNQSIHQAKCIYYVLLFLTFYLFYVMDIFLWGSLSCFLFNIFQFVLNVLCLTRVLSVCGCVLTVSVVCPVGQITNGHHSPEPKPPAEAETECRLESPLPVTDDELSNVCVRDLVSSSQPNEL